jgi:hypothetical protein
MRVENDVDRTKKGNKSTFDVHQNRCTYRQRFKVIVFVFRCWVASQAQKIIILNDPTPLLTSSFQRDDRQNNAKKMEQRVFLVAYLSIL